MREKMDYLAVPTLTKPRNKVIGNAILYLGDCLNVMAEIPDRHVDMILCDLPYGTTTCKWDTLIPFEPLWAHYKRVIKSNGAIVLFSQSPFDKVMGCSNLSMLRYEFIWEKTEATGHLNAKRAPMKAHENILVFYSAQPTYNPQKTNGHKRKVAKNVDRSEKQSECYGIQSGVTHYDSTERYPRSVIKFSTDKQKSTLHPTQKPVALCEYLINTYTKEREIVLDNCMGSGTTGIACYNTKRTFIGIEKERKYFEIACERIAQAQRQLWK
jgi:site-specific DNA-methyltransferase (adenine-specific)